MTPFWMVGIDALMPGGEPLTRRRVLGLIIGFIGIAMLVWPEIEMQRGGRGFLEGVIALNVIQVALFMREVIPIMRKQKSGSVINVSSIAARHGGGAGAIIYAGAKGFISTATHGWAKEVVADGIRVNAVSPGVIATPFHERYSTPEQLKAMQAMIPMNRLGTAEECAGTFVYLASDAMSGYVTGQVIEVNGGQYMP